MLSEKLKNFFSFNKANRRGIIDLSLIILLVIAARIFAPYYEEIFYKKLNNDSIKETKRIFQSIDSLAIDTLVEKEDTSSYERISTDNLFYFNPNNLPAEQWKKLGLSERQIKVIKNFEAKGGKFVQKEDLKKIYIITEEIYQKLEPYIIIPDKKETKFPEEKPTHSVLAPEKKIIKKLIDINTADTTELKTIYGVGSYFAKAIVWYRNSLGGFVSKEQLLEIPKMSDTLYQKIESQIFIQLNNIEQININKADYFRLKKHPYISDALARLIVSYREQHGKYKQLSDLKKLNLMTEEIFQKVLPYLTID